jgi:DNA primase catalytic core
MRFTDPAEGAASLALREGLPEALGFYLDQRRVHVGDLTTLTDQVFAAWRHDSHAGHDTIMLAPTRELVSELNRRARAHRLGEVRPTDSVALTDGDQASVGDTVITRANNRRLRLTATDWVKNGDRWQVTVVHAGGGLTVRHTAHGRSVRLPADYVSTFVTLGYASTIHTVQGVTADTSHTLLTGEESRQLAYTALTRGKAANHLYLEVVDDGDPHNVIRPEHVHPLTATDLLERILARDESATSAHTEQRVAEDPATLLGEAVARYADSLSVGAEQVLGRDAVARLDRAAGHLVPALTDAPAWPTLRAHLLVLAAQHGDPVEHLRNAAEPRELSTAGDVAATLDWRLDDTGLRNAGVGPLPWLPGIPTLLGEDPGWGPYLAARAARVRDLTDQVAARAHADEATPVWAHTGQRRPDPDLMADVAVWRAATGVTETDRRPTGPRQFAKAAARFQDGLDGRLARGHTPALAEWSPLLDRVLGPRARDSFTPVLAERLSALARAGLEAPRIVRRAVDEAALPDDYPAAALWWRISRRLSPAVAAEAESGHTLATKWTPRLADLVGEDVAKTLRSSPWWPALVTTVDHAIARGTTADRLLAGPLPDDDVDPCQALVWRISLLTTDVPDDRSDVDPTFATEVPDEPNPFWHDEPEHPLATPLDYEWAELRPVDDQPDAPEKVPVVEVEETDPFDDPAIVETFLTLAATALAHAGPLPPSERMIQAQAAREFDASTAPVGPARILELNRLAVDYYLRRFPGSWAETYLRDRMRADLTGDSHVLPGYAPAGWTHLVDTLRRQGVSDLELTESGLASVARTGRLIDRFRDRLVLPILRRDGNGTLEPIGFVGRRHPAASEQTGGPKYLNTPDTPLFHKSAQLFTVRADLLSTGAIPVLVEGPIDALAVTLAGRGTYVGVAPLGTALTEEQAIELADVAARAGLSPVVATDADLAGEVAAQRDYWLLAQHALTPMAVTLSPGSDPADVLDSAGPEALRSILRDSAPLANVLVATRLDELSGLDALRAATRVLAASTPDGWDLGTATIAQRTGLPTAAVRRELARATQQWVDDPRKVAAARTSEPSIVRERASVPPSEVHAPRATNSDVVSFPPARSRTAAPRR